jgi:hypothetical protein
MLKIIAKLNRKYKLYKLREQYGSENTSTVKTVSEYLKLLSNEVVSVTDYNKLKELHVYTNLPEVFFIYTLLNQVIDSYTETGVVKYNSRLLADVPDYCCAMDWYWKSIHKKGISPVEFLVILGTTVDKILLLIEKEEDLTRVKYIHRCVNPILENVVSMADIIESVNS